MQRSAGENPRHTSQKCDLSAVRGTRRGRSDRCRGPVEQPAGVASQCQGQQRQGGARPRRKTAPRPQRERYPQAACQPQQSAQTDPPRRKDGISAHQFRLSEDGGALHESGKLGHKGPLCSGDDRPHTAPARPPFGIRRDLRPPQCWKVDAAQRVDGRHDRRRHAASANHA